VNEANNLALSYFVNIAFKILPLFARSMPINYIECCETVNPI